MFTVAILLFILAALNVLTLVAANANTNSSAPFTILWVVAEMSVMCVAGAMLL